MTNQFPWDTVLNIVFFAVGFIIGLAQLWQAQKFYLADQRNKFEQINTAVTQIAQRLAVIEGVTNRLIEIDRTLSTIGATSSSFQERLFGIVERQFSIGEQTGQVTVEASDQIKGLITQELSNSKVVTADNMVRVEEKVDRVLSELSTQLLQLAQRGAQPASAVEVSQSEERVNSDEIKFDSDKAAVIEVGNLRLDKQKGIVWVDGREVHLLIRTFNLLTLLMENADKLVSVEDINRTIFGREDMNSNVIFMHISRLRREIDPERKYIKSIRGKGFLLSSKDSEN